MRRTLLPRTLASLALPGFEVAYASASAVASTTSTLRTTSSTCSPAISTPTSTKLHHRRKDLPSFRTVLQHMTVVPVCFKGNPTIWTLSLFHVLDGDFVLFFKEGP